jgi:hypothetical protein
MSHRLISIDVALMLIEKYPAALQHQGKLGLLPLHIECACKGRSSILSICIELYPETLAITDMEGRVPLFWLLYNQFSSTEDALMLLEKCPMANMIMKGIQLSLLPVHMEAFNRCRLSVVTKCIELNPESLDELAIYLLIEKVIKSQCSDRTSILSIIFTTRPNYLYDQPNLQVDHRDNPGYRRSVLKLLPRHIFTPTHEADYQDLNWEPRSTIMMLLSQLKIKQLQQQLAQQSIMEDNIDAIDSSTMG